MDVVSLRQQLLKNGSSLVVQPIQRHEVYDDLGKDTGKQTDSLLRKVMGEDKKTQKERAKRKKIFKYIIDYLKQATVDYPMNVNIGKGINLAQRMFLAPSLPTGDGQFNHAQQYRWDSYFQNPLLVMVGAEEVAVGQLLNKVEVFNDYQMIPNALSSVFLSHPQPPLETVEAMNLVNKKVRPGGWFGQVMETAEKDLWLFWWDRDTGIINQRQSDEVIKIGKGYLTRYTSIHFLAGPCGQQDGKDYYPITAVFGEEYLPVQLNAILYQAVYDLKRYYQKYKLNQERVNLYDNILKEFKQVFNRVFWQDKGKFKGFRNYSLRKDYQGRIKFDDLLAEVWPLWARIADEKQAEITRRNVKNNYLGQRGLSTTGRDGDVTIENFPTLKAWKMQWYQTMFPPIMDITVDGLLHYSKEKGDKFYKDAVFYMKLYIKTVEEEFNQRGAIFEKYFPGKPFVSKDKGYYGTVKGFGWTIGAYVKFLNKLIMFDEL